MGEDPLERVASHFARYERPTDFISRYHCDECAEHFLTLLHVQVADLTWAHVGDGAWDPSCMLAPDAFKYYFPALARIADADREGWLDMLIARLPLHYTTTFTREDWLVVQDLLEYWWLDEGLSQFVRDGIERGLDVCRRGARPA